MRPGSHAEDLGVQAFDNRKRGFANSGPPFFRIQLLVYKVHVILVVDFETFSGVLGGAFGGLSAVRNAVLQTWLCHLCEGVWF